MKKKIILFAGLCSVLISAQQGKVGINTENPSATLDIVSKANTSATKALRIGNSSSTEMVTVRDNGQVGINQASPAADALLELNSTNKSLLLTRVNNATDVANPVNGMLVYDITQKCVRAYENSAWSGCLSASGGNGGNTGGSALLSTMYDFKGTFKDIFFNPWNDSNTSLVAGISTDDKLFVWGGNGVYPFRNVHNLFANMSVDYNQGPQGLYTPAYLPLPNNEIPLKVAVRDGQENNNLIVLTKSGKIFGIGNAFSATRGQWVDIGIPGESIVDINDAAIAGSPNQETRIAITASGKAYYWGYGNTITAGQSVTQWTQIAFPAGVDSSTFKYTKVLNKAPYGFTYFFKANDGNVYAIGENAPRINMTEVTGLGTGATSSAQDIKVKTDAPQKVLFPAGVDITKIEIQSSVDSRPFVLAIASDGTAYGWGLWKYVDSFTKTWYNFAIENSTTTDYVIGSSTNASQQFSLIKPHKLKLPAGSTIFKDVICNNSTTNAFIQTDKGVYYVSTKTSSNKITMDPVNIILLSNSVAYSQNNAHNGTDGVNDFVNKSEVMSLFDRLPYVSYDRAFGLDANGKAYFWGSNYGSYGNYDYSSPVPGIGYVLSSYVTWPLPLRTGTQDPFNPSPLY